jgi:oligosaccharyl transferase (archaeosortase A-associated)
MAKPSKGKKALKAEQKAARKEKAAPKATAVEQAVQPEKPKNGTPVEPEKAEPVKPVQPASIVDRAINYIKANASLYTVAIILLMAFMFYLRNMSASQVFTNWAGGYVNVAQDDGVYHMRLLFNTLQHFPFRILYDPFTHFPYGSMVHFGPLFELIPAAFLYIVGLGNPSDQLVGTVAAYYPAVLGTLVVIPTYYIGKKLFGRPAGLIGAIAVACMPGTILTRSMVGIFDHHVAEIFFMTSTIACLVYALDAARESKLSIEQLKSRDYKALKAPLIYGALTGLSLGGYLLNWPGALILAFTLFVFFMAQALIDHNSGKSLDYLLILSALVFLIPIIMVLPYSLSNLSFQSVYYSLTQPVLFLAAFAATGIIYLISDTLNKNKAEKWAFPVAVAGLGVVSVLALYILAPSLFELINYSISMLNPQGGFTTVGEVLPTIIDRNNPGTYTLSNLTFLFQLTFWTATLGLIALVVAVARNNRPSMLAFLVWNLVMSVLLIVQNRFTYYYGVNAALLTACLAWVLLGLAGYDALKKSFDKKVDSMENFQRFVKKNAGNCIIVAVIILSLLYVAIYPATPLSMNSEIDPSGQYKKGILFFTAEIQGGSGMPYEWFDALNWMANHTPDPQGSPVQSNFDYTSGQYWPPSNYGSASYSYPSSAYGVMSWWDYGHIIEYVAHRIPNANPFQAGIMEQNSTTGASPFFCTTDEAMSVGMLDKLGSRYVVIDNEMATGKFYAIQRWIGDTDGWETMTKTNITYPDASSGMAYETGEQTYTIVDTDKWVNSTMNRLYYGDANGMSHYRLVYESDGAYAFNFRFTQFNDQGQIIDGGLARNPMRLDNYTDAYDRYDILSRFVIPQEVSQGSLYVYGARPPVKYVKIFEKVEGATLTGSAPDGTEVTATLTLKTDWDRVFKYTAKVVAHDGTYSFIVPYPTEQMKGDGYSYGIMPQGKYSITYDNTAKSVDVPESAVMSGATIQVT